MDKDFINLVDLASVELNEQAPAPSSWVHALPIGEYTHPVFGKLSMTAQRIQAFAEGIKNKVRGIEPSINYMHGTGPSGQGDGEAAGWVKDAQVRSDGLYLFVEWTRDAAVKIKEKAWRYFSAEYHEKWTDSTGKTHNDVFFGGALTNRPFMKNLLPINLSESTIESAISLAETIAKVKAEFSKTTTVDEPPSLVKPEQEEDVDLKKLCELLGLPEGTTEADLITKLSELGKTTPPVTEPKKTPEVPVVTLSEELRKLSDENPMVKALIETVDSQNKALHEFNVQLREADVDRRLNEFDNSKIVLTPAAKDLVHDFAMDLPIALTERFWEILEKMRNSSSLMVELGERAGTSVRYGRAKDPVSQFMDMSNQIATNSGGKISLSEAMDSVARDNPKLYDEYRQSSFSFRE